MKLNQLTLISYAIDGDSACFILQTDLATAVALDGQALKVTTDAGDDVAAMDGHRVVAAVKQDDGYIALHTARALDPQTAESIKALETNVAVAKKAADAAQNTADAAQQKATTTEGAAAELGVIASQAISDGTDTQAAVAELGGLVADLTARVTALEGAKA